MTSWFAKASLPNIKSSADYFFVPDEHENFRVFHTGGYAENIVVEAPANLQRGVNVKAIPKDIISKLNPAKDFTFAVVITIGAKSYNFPSRVLESILTNDSLRNNECLTHGFLSSGGDCIAFEKDLLIASSGILVPKFTDTNIVAKLDKALNDAVLNRSKAAHFTLSSGGEGFSVDISINISDDLRKILKEKVVGPFVLPEIPQIQDMPLKALKVSTNSDLLVQSQVATI